MKRFRLSTLMLLVVIAALCITLVMQRRREANLQARLAQSWPVYLEQQQNEALLRHWLVAIRSAGGTQQQEREDAEQDRDIEAMKESAKAIETKARRRPR